MPFESLALDLGQHRSVRDAARQLAAELAVLVNLPVALLSRREEVWRFEGEGFPSGADAVPALETRLAVPGPSGQLDGWTGVVLGQFQESEWVLMVPGTPAAWANTDWLDQFGDSVRESLERVAVREEMIEANRRARRAYAFVRRLGRLSDVARVQVMILETMAAQVEATSGALALYDEAERRLSIVATHGYPRAIVEHLRIRPGEGILGQAFKNGRALVGRVTPEPGAPKRLRYTTDSYAAVPLKGAQGVLGVVVLADRADGHPFDQSDLEALRLLAAPASLALGHLQLRTNIDELTRMATIDVVTGLFNRRYFEKRLEAEIQRVRRQPQDLALLMVDLDNFKHVNDRLGHLAGDEVLRAVGSVLGNAVRIFDLCARYGGEEFVILMPGATEATAAAVAERVRRQISSQCSRASASVSASIGVGVLGPGETGEDLIARADLGLMMAKAAGKNTVRFGRDSESGNGARAWRRADFKDARP